MSSEVKIDWSNPLALENSTDGFPADQLDREKYAKFLTHFLASKGVSSSSEKHNYVLNLNAEWGSGKSYFLRRWAEDLKGTYPVVYVDAWKQDYSDDPLMTVISSMIKQLREQADKGAEDPLFKTPRKLIGLLKAAAPSIARGLATKYLGVDPVKIIQQADDEDIGETVKDSDGKEMDMGLAASKMVEHLLSEHDAKSSAISSLKVNVEQWVEAVVGLKEKHHPAFIFIDELDRCRPSYAVEMLETIKHIFDIPGVVFVVATDTEQLQHTVKAIYGEGFDARTYLGRFFNSRYTLKVPSFEKLLPVHCDMEKLSLSYLQSRKINNWPELDVTTDEPSSSELKNLTAIYNSFSLPARQIIQITERLISIVENLKENSNINLLYLAFLLCLREKNQALYDLVLTKDMEHQLDNKEQLGYEVSGIVSGSDSKKISIGLRPSSLFTEGDASYLNPIATANNIIEDSQYELGVYSFIVVSHTLIKSGHPRSSNLRGEAIRSLSNRNNCSDTKSWFILLAETENKKSNYGMTAYKDLVELASALDMPKPEEA
ncbi:KAP family NTPase [Shewanella sp. D64]|uniref:KAP family P-loop NTPase fold protein n=1 Tax=unclassified Shewanella TaxID=196818 RepID=UPI0022BA27D5|nr:MULTISPECIES: P-loop NTPase fold protein [unclassified Shewanella]MEC4726274.1 KAP family NTPase [Shewanella sp. D64]MEC4738286.1 KAP family NTPase [Shewanella sp. E94]WBJ95423.1 KAP family NTPase [Shewanella sp. MTB7]